MENNETSKEILQLKYEKLISIVDPKKKKYFHFKSVSNFILYFEKIAGANDRYWIFDSLNAYLDECMICQNSIDRNLSDELYTKYLNKLGDYYHDYLGFALTSIWIIVALPFIGMFFILIIFFNWRFSLLLALSLFTVNVGYIIYKRNKHKTFGLFH